MKLSVIVPCYNEEGVVGRTVRWMNNGLSAEDEVIVCDGGSDDETLQEATEAGARAVCCPQKGRAAQMNHGAAHASGDILFFVHADTLPPPDFREQIQHAVDDGADFGCMRLRFDSARWPLRLKAWFSRFRASGLHYGDQGLFVRRSCFDGVGGFDARMQVFEDLDIIERLRKQHRFMVLHGPITTSARKYQRNSALRMQLAFYVMVPLYRSGASQQTLVNTYKRLVRQDKL